ncbi:MAG: hypothetical protein ACXWEE_06340 [Thermoleophilaceae bacterium]
MTRTIAQSPCAGVKGCGSAADGLANGIAHGSAMPDNGPQLDNRRVLAGIIDLMVVLAGALVIGYAAGLTSAEYGKAGLAM